MMTPLNPPTDSKREKSADDEDWDDGELDAEMDKIDEEFKKLDKD